MLITVLQNCQTVRFILSLLCLLESSHKESMFSLKVCWQVLTKGYETGIDEGTQNPLSSIGSVIAVICCECGDC